jgi:hypothetical protein
MEFNEVMPYFSFSKGTEEEKQTTKKQYVMASLF